ncbi:MAG: 5-(carboxyamino)imidazole ribonucleotide synthase [Gammaproteobacteria bacterium]
MTTTVASPPAGAVPASVRPRAGAAPRLGIIGAGQLARMTAQAALQLGCEVSILANAAEEPACTLTRRAIFGSANDAATVLAFAREVDVVTLENEFVDAGVLAELEAAGIALHPGARSIALVQDKFVQKSLLASQGIATPAFRAVATPAELADAGREFDWPVVLKTRRNGYDGKGNLTLRGSEAVADAWAALGGAVGGVYVEQWCPFVAEVAVIVTRARDGQCVLYPVVETVQRDHICHRVLAPAALPAVQRAEVAALAERAVCAVEGVGSFGVELFVSRDGAILVNELAPRVHNSGHYTIEACACSQFENHVRAVMGWPLGATAMRVPAAVMVNLLGAAAGDGAPTGREGALAVPETHLHVYGKRLSARGRKMGHVTALGPDLDTARQRAEQAAACIRFGAETQA